MGNYQDKSKNNKRTYKKKEYTPFNLTFQSKWIAKEVDKEMIRFCNELGCVLKKNDVSSSQLRNIYGEIIRIKLRGIKNEIGAFLLLKPKIAYNAARIKNFIAKKSFETLLNILNKAIDNVDPNEPKTFDNFQKFFEAILAYHKYYENTKTEVC